MFKNKIKYILLTLLFFFIFPQKVNAQIVINEILPNPVGDDTNNEWVELYNTSSIQTDLTGYKVIDASGHEQLLSGIIVANGWFTFYSQGSFSLNNTNSETVNLFDSVSVNPIDSYQYTDSSEGKSWGRYPDGGSISSQVLPPTFGTANQLPATPSPSPSPTASPTESPTSPPTAVPTQAPTASPTKSPSPTLVPTKSPTPKPTPTESGQAEESSTPEPQVLSLNTTAPDPEVVEVKKTEKRPILAVVLISLGSIFLCYGVYLLYNTKNAERL